MLEKGSAAAAQGGARGGAVCVIQMLVWWRGGNRVRKYGLPLPVDTQGSAAVSAGEGGGGGGGDGGGAGGEGEGEAKKSGKRARILLGQWMLPAPITCSAMDVSTTVLAVGLGVRLNETFCMGFLYGSMGLEFASILENGLSGGVCSTLLPAPRRFPSRRN